MTELNGALVLVTGATGGFGAHMVNQFHAAGSRLIVSDHVPDSLDGFADTFVGRGGALEAVVAADLSTAEGCRELHAQCNSLGLTPDILINNAGIALAGRHDHVPADRWEMLMQVNLLSPMRLSALFLPQMIRRSSGHIVNISSLAGWIGSPFLSSYCASKFGLRGFSESLASDLRPHSINVSTVFPSFSKTPILDSEQFGLAQKRVVPEKMLSDPAGVVAKVIAGVRNNKTHIYPDTTSKLSHYVARFFPSAIPALQRRLERKIEHGS